MHLTKSHMYAFKRITRVRIQQDHTCMHLTESQVRIEQNHTCMYVSESQVCI